MVINFNDTNTYIYIFGILVILYIIYYVSTYKESMTNTSSSDILRCVSNGNYWVGRCIPPNASNIKCVVKGDSWVNNSCVPKDDANMLENALLCAKNKDVYVNNVCINKNKLKGRIC